MKNVKPKSPSNNSYEDKHRRMQPPPSEAEVAEARAMLGKRKKRRSTPAGFYEKLKPMPDEPSIIAGKRCC